MCYIDTIEQTDVIFTKALNGSFLFYLQRNDLDGDLKIETFASTRGSLRIRIKTQTHNSYN